MQQLLLFALAGFVASLVDGALGMGFGPTSSSILLLSGLAPAAVSTSVNLAKVFAGIAAGISHWKFRNLDRALVLKLAVPGCVGAIVGVTVLSSIDGNTIRPYLAVLLTIAGVRILVRFARPLPREEQPPHLPDGTSVRVPAHNLRGLTLAAFIGGITNGMIGAWGPVVTPFLLHRAVRPRFAIGCVNTAEIAVASASAVSLLAALGANTVNGGLLVAMLIGGVIAAPLAAWVIRYVPPRPMGIAVGGLLLLTNARDLIAWSGIAAFPWGWGIYLAILVMFVLSLFAFRGRPASTEADGVVAAATART
jgi:uncharacterized membrane protein YfcA